MKDKKLFAKLAYYGVLIIAIVFIVQAVLTALDVDIRLLNLIINILERIAILFMVIVVVFVGWDYAEKQPLITKVIFLVAAVLGVLSAAAGVINAF